MKKEPSIYHVLPFITPVLAVLLLAGPSYYLYTSVIESGNDVYITATVPDSTSSSSASSSSTSSAGVPLGVGTGGGTKNNEASSEENEGSGGSQSNASGDQIATTVNTEETSVVEEESGTTAQTPEPAPPTSTVYFGGYTFPHAEVTFTLNGEESFIVQADDEGYFEGRYEEVQVGENTFSFVAESYDGNSSNLVSYAYEVQNESPVYIPYILLPPVIYITGGGEVEGVAIPGSTIQVYGVSSEDKSLHVVDTLQVDADGNFDLDFDLGQKIPYEQFYLSCELENSECGYSQVIRVQTVGSESRFIEEIFADFTQDVKVNFVDFAFMRAAFLSGEMSLLYDLNQDGVLSLEDFSLLNYQWTL